MKTRIGAGVQRGAGTGPVPEHPRQEDVDRLLAGMTPDDIFKSLTVLAQGGDEAALGLVLEHLITTLYDCDMRTWALRCSASEGDENPVSQAGQATGAAGLDAAPSSPLLVGVAAAADAAGRPG